MSYLLDKKNKRKKILKILIIVFCFFILFYFRFGILKGLSFTAHFISRPFFVLGKNIGNGFNDTGSYFSSKKILLLENETLKLKLNENEAWMSNYNSLLDENVKLKEILERKKSNSNFILGAILAKPNRSFYDTIIIDLGERDGVFVGQRVFAKGNIPIGYIAEVFPNSSKVVLYSSPGEKTDVVISGSDAFMQLVGRGGGNFEMILPRDFILEPETEIILPGINSFLLAEVKTIISDPRDSYQKALLSSPVNIFQLKFVEVEK